MSEQATTVDPNPAEGAAPTRSPGFNQMAEALKAAMAGSKLPDSPSPTPTPPQPKPNEAPPAPKPKEEPAAPAPAPAKEEEPENPIAFNWTKLRKEKKQLEQEVQKLKTESEGRIKSLTDELKAAKESAKVATTPQEAQVAVGEIDALKKAIEAEKTQRSKVEEELKIVALERTPEFRDHFQKRFDAAMSAAKEAVPADAQSKAEAILGLPPSEYRKALVNDLVTDLSEYDKSRLAVAIFEMDKARSEKMAALKDHEVQFKKREELEAIKRAEQQKALEAQQDSTIKNVLSAARERFSAFQSKDGDEAHNAFVKTAEGRVQKFFKGQLTPDEMVILPVLASEYEVVSAEKDRLTKELQEAKKTIAAYEATSPKVDSGSKTPDGKPKGFMAKYHEAVGNS